MKTNLVGMLPTKKWLTVEEAMSYTACGRDKFAEVFANKVSVSLVGKTKVYKVSDIDRVIEQNILIAC